MNPSLRVISDTSSPAPACVAQVHLPGMDFDGRRVLGSIDLGLYAGETVALTGPSGVGKTTLMRILAGLETRHRGTVTRPKHLGMVFQEPTLLPWRTLRDNLILTCRVTADAAEQALDEVGLGGRGDSYPGKLSLGQQRRMSLARAFTGQVDLLLMDEPFVSLDAALANDMMTLFEQLRAARPVTTLIVTHAMREAQRLADRILILSGQPAEISDKTGSSGT